MEVVVGLHRRSRPNSYTVRVPVSKEILNSKYNSRWSPWASTFLTSDIMLLKLAHPVDFNDAVSPVCLPSPFQVLPVGKRCYTSGWGRLSSKPKRVNVQGRRYTRSWQVLCPATEKLGPGAGTCL